MPSLSRHDTVFVLRFAEPADPAEAPDNALSPAFLDSVEAALAEVEGSEGPAALVTTGAGKYYSTGLDLGIIGGDPEGLPAYVSRVQRLYARLLRLETPTVAAVNGHAFAGGAMLTLCHDHRIMRADRGYWNLPEAEQAWRGPPGWPRGGAPTTRVSAPGWSATSCHSSTSRSRGSDRPTPTTTRARTPRTGRRALGAPLRVRHRRSQLASA
jgi:hypothetical protein